MPSVSSTRQMPLPVNQPLVSSTFFLDHCLKVHAVVQLVTRNTCKPGCDETCEPSSSTSQQRTWAGVRCKQQLDGHYLLPPGGWHCWTTRTMVLSQHKAPPVVAVTLLVHARCTACQHICYPHSCPHALRTALAMSAGSVPQPAEVQGLGLHLPVRCIRNALHTAVTKPPWLARWAMALLPRQEMCEDQGNQLRSCTENYQLLQKDAPPRVLNKRGVHLGHQLNSDYQ